VQSVQSVIRWNETEIYHAAGERRARPRYALRFPLHYRVLGEEEAAAGSGTTLNLSSSGVAFDGVEALKLGAHVELAIQWPVALNGRIPLKLMVEGLVTWNHGGLAAIRMSRCEFRTQRKNAPGGSALP
jgi:PilZ domain